MTGLWTMISGLWAWCRTRPVALVGLGVGCGTVLGLGLAQLRQPSRVEASSTADAAGRATSQAQLQVTERRGQVVTVERVRRRPTPAGVVELTTRRTVEEPVVVQLGAVASGSSELVTHQEERRVEERRGPSLLVGASVGYQQGVPTFGGFAGVLLGPVVLQAQGEGGRGGVWSARGMAGLAW